MVNELWANLEKTWARKIPVHTFLSVYSCHMNMKIWALMQRTCPLRQDGVSLDVLSSACDTVIVTSAPRLSRDIIFFTTFYVAKMERVTKSCKNPANLSNNRRDAIVKRVGIRCFSKNLLFCSFCIIVDSSLLSYFFLFLIFPSSFSFLKVYTLSSWTSIRHLRACLNHDGGWIYLRRELEFLSRMKKLT